MPTLPRGAKPTPRHKLAACYPFDAPPHLLAPTEYAVVPKQLSFWLNNQTGDCVTAEEAFAKAAFSTAAGGPELFVPDSEVQAWAAAGGFLNGANLTDVMDAMAQKGFLVAGVLYGDGPYLSVDYSNESVLQAAIVQGPVKIGIDADALPQTAGQQQGWYATGGSPGQFASEDHCVSLCGFGTAQYLFAQLGVALPAGLAPTATGYLLFTWSSIGFVDHAWIMSTCGEAWVRNPTTPGEAPAPPVGPPAPPAPVPPVTTLTGTTAPYTGTIDMPAGVFGRQIAPVPFEIPALAVTVALPTPTKGAEGVVLDGPFIKFLRRGHLLAELNNAGMPNAAGAISAAVASGSWSDILNWIVTNAPAILAFITQLIALFSGA